MIKQEVIDSLASDGGLQLRDLSIGATVRVNHIGCSAGEDTRKRLYVTRKPAPNDLVVAYCHNCGQGMGIKAKPHRFAAIHKTTGKVGSVVLDWEEGLPITEVPFKIKNWFNAKGFPNIEDYDTGWIKWHPLKNCLMFGIVLEWSMYGSPKPWGEHTEPMAIQYRYFDGRIKWLTNKGYEWPDDKPLRSRLFLDDVKSDNIIIVEDLLSAKKLFYYTRVGDADVYCLFGAHCSIDELAELRHTHGYKGLGVWLDNDGPHVVESRDTITKRAKLVGFDDVRVERKLKDPKYSSKELLARHFKEYEIA